MTCILQNDTIDSILNSHKVELGDSFEPYRNHVYRVYNFAILSLTDSNDINTLSVAVAFHDLGIWTKKTFDYIQPSIDLARHYCLLNLIETEKIVEIEFIIKEHHKLSKISNNRLAEIFRKADLVDLSLGMIRKNIDRKYIRKVKENFPNKGFHLYLSRLFLKNLFLNPLRPLPMYKF
ncbi:MAG: phosphohydrolase [Bacteroidales bacterium]|nr:phosphohydrolase [Bacteroidales bacterium]